MFLALKSLFFVLVFPGTVAVYLPLWIAGDRAAGPWWLRLLACPPLLLGATALLWCVWDFARQGRGTLAPVDPPKRLVVRGLYNLVRNPMYVGVLAMISGWALWFAAPVLLGYGALVWLGFHLVVVLYEEPWLRRTFPDDYARYSRSVHRWLPRRCHRPTVIPVTDRVTCLHRREYLSCCYVVQGEAGLVLVDTGIDPDARDVLAGLDEMGCRVEEVTAILLTHWHNDHSSGAAEIQRRSGARVYYHADAAERLTRVERAAGFQGWLARQIPAVGWLAHVRGLLELAPLHPVAATRLVAEGDRVEGMRVLETPGHESGHLSFYLEEEGVLFAGDAVAVAGEAVTFMSRWLTADTEAARRSMLRCVDLGARAICPGHRYPLLEVTPEVVAAARARIAAADPWPIIGC